MAKKTTKQPVAKVAPKPAVPNVPETKQAPAKTQRTYSVTTKLCLILAAISCLVYANTLRNGFVLDDSMVYAKNTIVTQGFKGIPELLRTPRLKGFGYLKNENYRPLSLVVHAIECGIFNEPSPAAGHFVNVLFFAGCVILLFLFLDRLFEGHRTGVAFVTALLFAVHPIHTEVVANIKSLDEILCFFFAFLGLYVFTFYMREGKIWQLLVGLAALFLSFLSKETVITFLAIIPLVFFFYLDENRKRALFMTLGAVVVAGIYLAIRKVILDDYGASTTAVEFIDNALAKPGLPVMMRIATAILGLGYYVKLLFIPHPLLCDYCYDSIQPVGFGNIWVLLSLAIYLSLLVVGVYRLIKDRKDPWAFGMLFFLATMSLFTNVFFLMGAQLGERFTFFASAGFCLLIALVIEKWVAKGKLTYPDMLKNIPVMAVLVPVCLIFSVLTFARNNDWKDNYTLYKTDADRAPNDCRLNFYLGNELMEDLYPAEKDTAKQRQLNMESIRYIMRAIEIYPDYTDAHTEAGTAYLHALNYDSASYHFLRAIALSPYSSIAANNLGTVYMRQGKLPEAVKYYNLAIKIKGDFTQSFYNLGCCYMGEKKYDSALAYLNHTLELDPNFPDVHQQIGLVYYFSNQFDKAEPEFKKTLAINPNDINAMNNLGATYIYLKRFPEALAVLNKLVSLSPGFVNGYSNMGHCYFQMKQYQSAIDVINKALSLDPKDVKDIPYLAMSYKGLGNMEMALKYEAIARQYYSDFKLP